MATSTERNPRRTPRTQRRTRTQFGRRPPRDKQGDLQHGEQGDLQHIVDTGLPPGIDTEDFVDPGSHRPGKAPTNNRSTDVGK